MGEPASGLQYIKSVHSFLKLLEVIALLIAIGAIALLIAIGAVGYFLKEYDGDYDKKDNLKFFVAAAAITGILAVFFFLMFLIGIHKKIKVAIKAALIIFAILAILMLVASSLLAYAVNYYEDHVLCDFLEFVDADAQCKHLIAGTVCGFIAAALFIVDAIVHSR